MTPDTCPAQGHPQAAAWTLVRTADWPQRLSDLARSCWPEVLSGFLGPDMQDSVAVRSQAPRSCRDSRGHTHRTLDLAWSWQDTPCGPPSRLHSQEMLALEL